MSTCRGCLAKEADVYQSLFSKIEMIPVQDMFQSLTGLTVCREDGLPRYICQECCEDLLHFYKLREKMLQSNAYLQSSIAPAVATCDGQGKLGQEKGVSNERSAPTTPLHMQSETDHSLGDEINSDEFVPPAEKRRKITAIEIERIDDQGETVSMLLESGQLDDESFEKCDFDDHEDDHRSEYLFSDLESAHESDLAANETVGKEKAPEGSSIYCCGCPSLQFNSQEDLAQHSQEVHAKNRVYNNVRPYECNTCYKRYLQYDRLEQHQIMPYRERKFACKQPGCDARFLGRSALLSHNKSKHLRVRAYVCDSCEKSFYTSATLQSHRIIHTSKQYQCQTCQKMFLRQSDLLMHQATHLDERPFGCEQCDKRFKTRNHLRTHQYVHSSERRLKCELCDASFTTYNDRLVHLLSHKNIDRYKCSYCDKVFKRNFKLQGHIRKVHTGERPYECTQCPQKFYENWQLTGHLRHEHGTVDTGETADVIKVMVKDQQLKES